MLNPLAPELTSKIRSFVGEGVHQEAEMKRHLAIYVSKELFAGEELPSKSDRLYHPSKLTH